VNDNWIASADPRDKEAFSHQAACAILDAEKDDAIRDMAASASYQAALKKAVKIHARIMGAAIEFSEASENDGYGGGVTPFSPEPGATPVMPPTRKGAARS